MTATEAGEYLAVVLVSFAAATDLRSGRIFNWSTYPAVVVGLALGYYAGGLPGLGDRMFGLAVGFVPFFLLYLRSGLGGGDVKLMAAVGSLLGMPLVFNSMVAAILFGGLLAALIVVWQGHTVALLKFLGATIARVFSRSVQPFPLPLKATVPFGVAICLGTFFALISSWLGYASPSLMTSSYLWGG